MKDNPFIELPIEELDVLFESTDSVSPDLTKIGEAIEYKMKNEGVKSKFNETFTKVTE